LSSSDGSLPLRFVMGDPPDVATVLGESGMLVATEISAAQKSRHNKEKDDIMSGVYCVLLVKRSDIRADKGDEYT